MITPTIHTILLIDISSITLFLILSSLSKQIGEALKTPPYYRLYYGGVILIVLAIMINTLSITLRHAFSVTPEFSSTLPMGLRFISGLIAVFSSMQYWKWLFSEYLKK